MTDPQLADNVKPFSKVRILSIDGGGIRGIIPATIICYLEEEIRRLTQNENAKIGEYFDLIAGTSTGGILASIYLVPQVAGTTDAKYSAIDALNLYKKNGHLIFEKSFIEQVTHIPLINEKYSAKNLQKLLDTYFQKTLLSELIRPCLITSYDFFKRRAVFFNSNDARCDSGVVKDFYVNQVTRATSAAPTYFEPVQIKSLTEGEFNLIDGGVFVNNPAMCAFSEARNTNFNEDRFINNNRLKTAKPNKPKTEQMYIVSIGTGSESKPFQYNDLKNAGLISWVPVLIDIMMSANSETVDYHLRKMFEAMDTTDQHDYIRLKPSLGSASSEMDDASADNIESLYEAGNMFVYENTKKLKEIAKRLVEYS